MGAAGSPHDADRARFLSAPPYNYAFLSNPVVDPEFVNDVIPAFFDAIERQRSLPNVIRLRYLDGNSNSYSAILKALAVRGGQTLKLAERERPYACTELGLKHYGFHPQEAAAGLEPAVRPRHR